MRETYAERTLRSDLCVCPTCDDCPREHYASTIYDLLVQLNDGTYSRDVDEAEEAKQRLFLLYPIQSGYDPGRYCPRCDMDKDACRHSDEFDAMAAPYLEG